MKKLQLLLLVFKGIISFKYWLKYNTKAENYIIIMNNAVSSKLEAITILFFNKELQLVGEDVYKIVGVEKNYLNKEINNPIPQFVYVYNSINYEFECIIN